MSLTPAQRTLRARLAAHTLHAQIHDPAAHTQPARDAFMARFYDQVDPERTLPEDVRERLATHARKAHYSRMALKRWGGQAATD